MLCSYYETHLFLSWGLFVIHLCYLAIVLVKRLFQSVCDATNYVGSIYATAGSTMDDG